MQLLREMYSPSHTAEIVVGFWDPLGLAADGDAETFKRRRETDQTWRGYLVVPMFDCILSLAIFRCDGHQSANLDYQQTVFLIHCSVSSTCSAMVTLE